jgi:uncharacterized protein YhaN
MSLRVERFELRAFGPFTHTALELRDAAAGALHVICGPNEIGKSTAQRGIGDFFFGIPPRSTDNQLHDYNDMRLAGVLIDEHGRRHQLVRRKGSRSTLLGLEGEPIDEGLLESMLGGMTREVFESMFSITHESLVVGGNALLAADGDLGESLFSASLGASGLHELRAELDLQADKLFRPRATSSLVLLARAALETAQSQQRESTLRATTFTEHERHLKAARAEREQVAEQIRDARTAQSARTRLRTIIPLLATRRHIRDELAGLADAPDLPHDAPERRVRASERAASERNTAQDARMRVADLTERIGQLADDPVFLDRELAIKDVHGRLVNAREGASDLERQTVKLQTATGLAQSALDQIRPGIALDDAEQMLLTETRHTEIDRALDRHATLAALLEKSDSESNDAEGRAREIAGQLEALDVPPDTAALASAVTDAHVDGHVEQRLADAEDEFDEAQTQLDAELRELDPATDVQLLRALRPPSAAAVEQFALERDALDARARELEDSSKRFDDERRNLDEVQANLNLSTNAPTIEDLGVARDARDEHWRRLRRRLEGDEHETSTPEVFEAQMRRTDHLSDRLRAEAESVARRAELALRERRLNAELEDLDGYKRTLATELSDHEQRWVQAWSATEIEPRSPREMADWLQTRQAIFERVETLARRARTKEGETHTRDRHLGTLRGELIALECEPPTGVTLRRLLAMAQTKLSEVNTAREGHAELKRNLRLARTTATRQREKADEHLQALKDWQQAWAQTTTANGWPDGVGADSARQILAAVNELAKQLHEANQLRTRVEGIQDRLNTFARDAEQIIEDVAPELGSWPVPDAVAELARRLTEALQIRSRRQTLEEELDTAKTDLKTAERTVGQATGDLEALADSAGVASAEELPEAERRAARAFDLRAQLPELELQITEAGQAPLSKLVERAGGVDVDSLDAEVAEAEQQLKVLEQQLQDLDVRLGELGSDQQKMELVNGAASAAELVEQQVAELRELTARYLRLYLAAWVLSEAIDAYRREHKAPLLKRADELFPRLTCGHFKGLEVSFDEADTPVLVGIRGSGEKVPVKVMSTGTREQLYLALRLASLERHVELHGPMMVILDDVVLHSDPQRKSAILAALAELGRRTQVIAFTHDPQVVALAQNTINPDLLTVHELGGTEITGALQPQIATADVRPIRPAKAA